MIADICGSQNGNSKLVEELLALPFEEIDQVAYTMRNTPSFRKLFNGLTRIEENIRRCGNFNGRSLNETYRFLIDNYNFTANFGFFKPFVLAIKDIYYDTSITSLSLADI